MAQVPRTPPTAAGDYLVATFAEMLHTPRFRTHVWAQLQLAERQRLEALRLQALYGDAPVNATAGTEEVNKSSAPGTTATLSSGTEASAEASTQAPTESADKAAAPATPPSTGSRSAASPRPGPPRWFDIAGRARYAAWVALRGRMAPDVAAECFCSEFLGVMHAHPHPTLLPLVEAALSTARGLAQRSRTAALASTPSTSPSSTPAPSSSRPRAAHVVFEVRALQGDPAALALLWICRAYRLPCAFVIEPLSKALGTHHAAVTDVAAPAGAAGATANPYLPYTMADTCYPFTASLVQPVDGAGPQPSSSTSTTTTTVTSPEAAFVLLTDTFLAAYPHWMGVLADPATGTTAGVGAAAPAQAIAQRSVWLDELQHITRHVRTPLLALLVHQATQSQRRRGGGVSAAAEAAQRRDLLRAVAAHLHCYERWAMERVLSRRLHHAQSVLSPLLASTAVVDCLRQAYAPQAKVVSAADAYVASCGYALCTHPFCADVFPLLRVPALPAVSALPDAVHPHWPTPQQQQSDLNRPSAAASGEAGTYVPWALPLYLSGMPAEYNETINRLLRREAKGTVQQAQHQQPIRLFIHDEPDEGGQSGKSGDVKTINGTSAAVAKASAAATQLRRAGHYAVSSASPTKEAAEAVLRLIVARLGSLRTDDLSRGADAVGSTSSVSGAPFLVLENVFALTWALCQEQVPGFPYFMVDGNPDHHGGFSFLSEGPAAPTQKAGGPATRGRGRFQASMAPAATVASTVAGAVSTDATVMLPAVVDNATAPVRSASSQDGGQSIESRLRYGWQAAAGALVKGVARLTGSRASSDDDAGAAGVHTTQVLRSDGDATAATSRL